MSQRRSKGSPEDAVGGSEVKAASVHFLHVAHIHVNEGDTNTQLELLMGGWKGRRARLTAGLRCRVRTRERGSLRTRKSLGRRKD